MKLLLEPKSKQSYAEYLKTSHWKLLRQEAFQFYGNKCFICPSSAKEVHHTEYREWFDVTVKELRPLCGKCHDTVHKIMGTLPSHINLRDKWIICEARCKSTQVTVQKGSVDYQECSYSKKELASINIPWPPKKGWKDTITSSQLDKINSIRESKLAAKAAQKLAKRNRKKLKKLQKLKTLQPAKIKFLSNEEYSKMRSDMNERSRDKMMSL